jgi:hypothetical protein
VEGTDATTFDSQIKSKVGNILTKSVALCINLNIDGVPTASRSHTTPSHSRTSRFFLEDPGLSLSQI